MFFFFFFFLSVGLNSKSTGPWIATVYEHVIFVVSDGKRIKTFHCSRIAEREDGQREEETEEAPHTTSQCQLPMRHLPQFLPSWQTFPDPAGWQRLALWFSLHRLPRLLPPQDDPVPRFQRRKALAWSEGTVAGGGGGGAGDEPGLEGGYGENA